MGGLVAKKSNTTATKLSGIQVQSSVYGRCIPHVFGTARVSPNLIWYNDFKAIAQTSKTKTGGKGGGGQKNTTYTYQAALMFGLCAGPIASIRKVFKDKSVFVDGATTALQQAGLSLALGADNQATWAYLTTNHPTQALPYAGLAYAYAPSYALGDQANITNHGFEVVSSVKAVGRDDCAPADIIEGVTNSLPLWQSGLLADLTDYRNYCIAAGFWFSLAQQEQVGASELLSKVLRASNSEAVWTGGQFKIIPYGDTQITKDGTTWTPNLTPVYDIDDSITNDAGDQDPIIYSRTREADYFNQIQVDYLDRARDYADANVPAEDPAGISEFGLRKASPEDFNFICDKSVAEAVAQTLIGRKATIRREFTIELPPQYCLLEPMDLITLTRDELELDKALVRVLKIDEDEEGDLQVRVEEVLVGAGVAAQVVRQTINGYVPNFDADSGNALAPILIQPPRQMTEGALEMWVATSGGANWGGAEIWASLDGTSYERQGLIAGPSRYGVTTSALAIGADPHNTTLGVNIAASGGTLDPATQAEFDAGITLCMVGNEVIAYRDATLTGAGLYTLGWLRRGLFGTAIEAHAIGSPFVRLDAAVTGLPFLQSDIGRTIHIKLRSYNVYGRRYQDLADVSAYDCALGLVGAIHMGEDAVAASEWDNITGTGKPEDNADVTANAVPNIVSNVSVVNIEADYQGAVLAGQLPKTVNFSRFRGATDVSATTTWSIFSAPNVTCTIGGTGILSITAISATSNITIRSVRDGVTLDLPLQVNKNLAAPPNTGGGGTTVNDTTLNGNSTATLAAVTNEMTVHTGASGQIAFSADLTFFFEATSMNGQSMAYARWEWKAVGGSFAAVVAENVSDTEAYDGSHSMDWEPSYNGSITCSPTKTGLSANTDYVVRLMGRRDSTSPAGGIFFFGNAQAVGS